VKGLVIGLASPKPGLAPREVHVVGKVALGHIFSDIFDFPVSITPQQLSIVVYHPGDEQ
jgi:hypothetical protein